MDNSKENKNISAREVAEEERKKKEQKEREKKLEQERIRNQAEAIACSYVRIAGTYYKKCQNPEGEDVLERVRASDIMMDFSRKLGEAILAATTKCINRVLFPEHINYKEYIYTPSGDTYYNDYRPLKYKPEEGDWPHIEELIQHIFEEQYELGLDYLQLMYMNPLQRLPILVLVSKENQTGKSTFCNFVAAMFGDNSIAITKDTLDNRFNSSWVRKIFAFCEETLISSPDLINKLKNYSTAEKVPSEAKGKDMQPSRIYIKLVLCSNDEIHPTIIDENDERHWVRKVHVINSPNTNKNFLEDCKNEIPAFMHFLQSRTLSTPGDDRLWFSHEETCTDAWKRIVAGSRTTLERGIIDLLLEIMDTKELDELSYSATELHNVVKNSPTISDKDKRNLDRLAIRDMLQGWGLYASKGTIRYEYFSMSFEGKVIPGGSHTGKAYTITRQLLESMV